MNKIKVFCAGKINLTLNILGKDPRSGLHYLDSIMQSVDIGDYVTVCARSDSKVNIAFRAGRSGLITQREASLIGSTNTVLKTVDILKQQFGEFGADIAIEKNLPLSGGLGGSSVDAAAVLVALDRLFNFFKRGLDITQTAQKIGSDVAFMLSGGCCRVTGTGQVITPINSRLGLYTVIVKARRQKKICSSGKIYGVFDCLHPDFFLELSDNSKVVDLLIKGDEGAVKMFSNALTLSAQTHAGGIQSICEELILLNALNAVMSGSGNCVAGFFNSAPVASRAASTLRQKGYCALACRLLDKGIAIC